MERRWRYPILKTLEAESQKSLKAAKAALTEFRESVDAVTIQYDQLSSDATVRFALHRLEDEKVGSFKLGPSPQFASTAKTLENAERLILAKKPVAVSRKKSRERK